MTRESLDNTETTAAAATAAQPQPDGFRLSPQQARLWRLLDLRLAHPTTTELAAATTPPRPRYLSQCALLLSGHLDQLLERHVLMRISS